MVLGLLGGCRFTPEPEIADQFHDRLKGRTQGWNPRTCTDKKGKIASLRDVVPLVHGLAARVRAFEAPLPPLLHADVMDTPLLGRADDYRCVVHDYKKIDLKTEPNYQAGLGAAANLFMYKGQRLLEAGERDEGWAHVLDALALYRDPLGPGFREHLTLLKVLEVTETLLQRHPPSPRTADALIKAVDRSRVPMTVTCSALRHDLLTQAVFGFRAHFGNREKQAMARRFGLDYAMKAWRSPLPGKLDRAVWESFRDIYDVLIPGCTERPMGVTVKGSTELLVQLNWLHPPTALGVYGATERLPLLRALIDSQFTVLATLRAARLRHRLGRDPTMAELALSFRKRPINPWDWSGYLFKIDDGVLTVIRGPHERTITVPALSP